MATPAPEAPVEEPVIGAPETPAEPETVTLPKAEAHALRQKLAEAERKANKLEADQKKAAEEQAAKQGEWQKLAEERATALAEKDEIVARSQREAKITRLATAKKFIDPTDVIGRVSADEATDDASLEAALDRIATQSPHLVAKEAPAVPEIGQVLAPSATAPGAATSADGKPAPPAGKAPVRSLDEFEALPQSERLARMAEADWLLVNGK